MSNTTTAVALLPGLMSFRNAPPPAGVGVDPGGAVGVELASLGVLAVLAGRVESLGFLFLRLRGPGRDCVVLPDYRPRASVLGFLALGPDGLAYRLLSAARCATIQRMIEYAVDITAGSLITADKQET